MSTDSRPIDLASLEATAKTVAAVGSVAAAAVYGTMYLATSTYYEAFGLTPAQAGVSQADLVGGSLAVFAIVSGAVSLAVLAAMVAARWLRPRPPWLVSAVAVILFVVAVVSLVRVTSLIRYVTVGPVALGAAVGGTLLAGSTGRLRPPRMRRWPALLLAIAVAGTTVTAVRAAARDLGTFVLERGAIPVSSPRLVLVGLALGQTLHPVDEQYAGGTCGVVVAHDADAMWILEQQPRADGKPHRLVRRIPADAAALDLDVRLPRPCWRVLPGG